jgi:hypothetical protein
MRFRQGRAPAVLYRDGKRLWEFYAGRLETDDAEIAALLAERGAVLEEGGVRSVESGVGKGAEAAPPEPPAPPEPAKPRRKTAKGGEAKQLHSPASTLNTEEAP